MSSIYDDSLGGGGLVWVGAIGVAIGFVAAKMGVSERSKARVCAAISFIFASVFALSASTPSSNGLVVELLGRGAIFGIVWFVFSILFTLGFSAGLSLGESKLETHDTKRPEDRASSPDDAYSIRRHAAAPAELELPEAPYKNAEKIVLQCPQCRQKLRVPNRHGIEITCPSCRKKFVR
jgi:hypothetical protein